jgi:hypothetical protein
MDIAILKDTISKANYICISDDGLITIHQNHREIAKYYKINHSTISKAFNGEFIANCKSKTYGNIAIRKLCNIPSE